MEFKQYFLILSNFSIFSHWSLNFDLGIFTVRGFTETANGHIAVKFDFAVNIGDDFHLC